MNIDGSYLKPPQEVYQVRHDPYYITHGEDFGHVRKIFYNQQFDQFEEQKLAEFENLINENNITLPDGWTRELTLRTLYSGGFVHKKALERLKLHLDWAKDPIYQNLNPIAEELLRTGMIYQFGRDKQFRPVVYIPLYLIAKNKVEIQQLLCAATNLLRIVRANMFVPGYVENWIVILDINGSGLFNTPFQTLKQINEVLAVNFSSTLHKMFILNPSFTFQMCWKLVTGIIHPETASKIQFVGKSEFKILKEHIDPSQIEQKYGGTHPNLVTYFPIVNTLSSVKLTYSKQNSMRPELEMEQSEYFSIDNDSNYFFKQEFQNQNGSGGVKDMVAWDSVIESQGQFVFNPTSEQSNACCTCDIF